MQKFLFSLALLFGMLLATPLSAQDIIFKKNGKEIPAKVIELGTAEVKYRPFDQPDGPIYVEDKENILKIVFQDGHTEFYGAARMDEATAFEGQKKAAIKISFLGPLIGYTNIMYERNIKPGRSYEIKACLIGLGKQYADKPRGVIGSAAYKFYKKPDFYATNFKRTHILQGAYVKPEVFLGGSSHEQTEYSTYPFKTSREQSFAFGLLLNLGKQWVMDNAFVLDLGFGVGYGAGTSTRAIYVGGDAGFAFTFSFNIGLTSK
ncbi:MAG: hypothetical protein ABIQ93_00400 [Saprospiraceae bacterium]